MCTLTYIPRAGFPENFILTDNRDEAVNRPAAFPKVYKELKTQLYYPKDNQAGGTWFGISKQKRAMALMNGAFKRHLRERSYRKSRGVVVKELLAAENLKETIEHYDFKGIEAFYGVVFSWNSATEITEIIWDGEKLHLQNKDPKQPHIWSSAMTFSPESHQQKKLVFDQFIKEHQQTEDLLDRIWDFHQSEESGMILEMGVLKTTSVSCFVQNRTTKDTFRFKDLITKEEQEDFINWKK